MSENNILIGFYSLQKACKVKIIIDSLKKYIRMNTVNK